MANEKAPQQVNIAIKTVLRETVTEQQQKAFENLRKECQLFLQRVDKIVKKNTEQGKLIQRIQFLGQLFHGDNATQTQVSDLVIIGHNFENALNKYLGRQIPLTIVSEIGNINILSEKTIIKLYKKAESPKKARGNRGHVANYDQDITKNKLHNPALTAIQKSIDKSIKNRKAVFQEGLTRRDDSKKMDYAQKEENKAFIPNLYWIINNRHEKNWTQKKIGSPGYIGQGYVALALDESTAPSKMITYQHNPLSYDPEAEQQIRLLSQGAQNGDKTPGILKGDVNVKLENGNIQLAVKQGKGFFTAGISVNFAIAYAILHYPQNELIMPQDLQNSLESIAVNYSDKWDLVYQILTGQIIKDINNMSINIIST